LLVESVTVNITFLNPVSAHVKLVLSIDRDLIVQLSVLEESNVDAVIVARPKLLSSTL